VTSGLESGARVILNKCISLACFGLDLMRNYRYIPRVTVPVAILASLLAPSTRASPVPRRVPLLCLSCASPVPLPRSPTSSRTVVLNPTHARTCTCAARHGRRDSADRKRAQSPQSLPTRRRASVAARGRVRLDARLALGVDACLARVVLPRLHYGLLTLCPARVISVRARARCLPCLARSLLALAPLLPPSLTPSP